MTKVNELDVIDCKIDIQKDPSISSCLGPDARRLILLCPDFGYGGAELSFAKIARLLSQRHEVVCAVFNSGIEQVYELGCPVKVLDGIQSSFSVVRFIRRIIGLRKLVKAHRADVVISFLEGADYVNYFSATKALRYASIRGSKTSDVEISGWRGGLRHALMRFVYPKFDLVIPVSQALKIELKTSFRVPEQKLFPIANFYDTDVIVEKSNLCLQDEFELAFSVSEVWINVGRLHPVKNQSFLLHFFKSAKNRFPRAKLAFVGDGPQRDDLIALCSDLGLTAWNASEGLFVSSADVWFLGYQKNPYSFIRRSSLFLFPSICEGFPNALVEAMVCGLPVITSDCPTGPAEILGIDSLHGLAMKEGEGGMLVVTPSQVTEKNITAWLDAVDMAYCNRSRFEVAGRTRAGHFSEALATEHWFNAISATNRQAKSSL